MKRPKLGSGARFRALEKKVEAEGNPADRARAIVASIGRKKFGAKKFSALAAKGRRRAEGADK